MKKKKLRTTQESSLKNFVSNTVLFPEALDIKGIYSKYISRTQNIRLQQKKNKGKILEVTIFIKFFGFSQNFLIFFNRRLENEIYLT